MGLLLVWYVGCAGGMLGHHAPATRRFREWPLHRPTREFWFAADANTVGRATLPE